MTLGPGTADEKARSFLSGLNLVVVLLKVELSGIEPLTPCLQSRCSPS